MSSNKATSRAHRWLCVAYAFPPVQRSGTHRTLGFVQQLSRMGWDATVVTVNPRGETIDDHLLKQVPPTTRVVRAPWVDAIAAATWLDPRTWLRGGGPGGPPMTHSRPHALLRPRSTGVIDWLSGWLHTPDSRIGWIAPAVVAGLEAIRRDRPRVIYSTSPYMSAHLIALVLRELTRLPWVADFRDPWRGNPFRSINHAAHDRWDAWLESAVLSRATRIVCNTPTMTKALRCRRPDVAHKCGTILNGFDRDRYADVMPRRVVADDEIALVHAGQFYGPRSPMPWFRALRCAPGSSTGRIGKLRLVLVGRTTFEGRSLTSLAAQCGVDAQVRVLGGKCHKTALSIMAGADALALAGATGPGAHLQVPNKLFECLALRRPVIAAVADGNPVRSILETAGARAIVCDPADSRALPRALTALAEHGEDAWSGTWTGVDQFDRAHAARQLLDLFEGLTRRRTERVVNRSSVLRRTAWPEASVSLDPAWLPPAKTVPTRVSALRA